MTAFPGARRRVAEQNELDEKRPAARIAREAARRRRVVSYLQLSDSIFAAPRTWRRAIVRFPTIVLSTWHT
ncbi:MAG: hypothetical protein DMG01_00865 [Acidobacteria bacterium]|nr:MAG: hypothetical protein DMG01_00865 [Acidobacteriota bacterium]